MGLRRRAHGGYAGAGTAAALLWGIGAGAAVSAGEPRQLCRRKYYDGAAGALAGLAVFLLYAGLCRRCAAVHCLCTAQCGADPPGGAAGLLAGAAHP